MCHKCVNLLGTKILEITELFNKTKDEKYLVLLHQGLELLKDKMIS